MKARIHVGVFRNVTEDLVDEYGAMKRTTSIATRDTELARSFEMPVPFRRTTRRSVPEDITINIHLHENLESHTISVILSFVKHHAMKSVGNGGKVPQIFRRGTRWRLVTSFIPPYPKLYFRGEKKTPCNYWVGDVTRPELEGKENLCDEYPGSPSSPCLTLRFYLKLFYVSRNALCAYVCKEVLRFLCTLRVRYFIWPISLVTSQTASRDTR
jgi:hypothetical protein